MEIQKFKNDFQIATQNINGLAIGNNLLSCIEAASTLKSLRKLLTDEVMQDIFLPLMNTKSGFLTDKDPNKQDKMGNKPKPYEISVVRDCLIDAITTGLLPTGNQFNILAGRMYATKEGYSALLKKLNTKAIFNIGYDSGKNQNYAEIPFTVSFEFNGKKDKIEGIASVKKDSYSSADALRGKAERKAKKTLFEYLTGSDLGDSEEETQTVDIQHEEIKTNSLSNEKFESALKNLPKNTIKVLKSLKTFDLTPEQKSKITNDVFEIVKNLNPESEIELQNQILEVWELEKDMIDYIITTSQKINE